MTFIKQNSTTPLRTQALAACRRLLSELNRDPAAPAYGCFDRRYWAWKTIDFPEATFQRNLAPLAWAMRQSENRATQAFYSQAIRAGLRYTAHIQHTDGSFDQAFPFERSYGASAFLLPDLLEAYLAIRSGCPSEDCALIEVMLSRTAAFLHKNAEMHGFISNHLAGAALGLLKAAEFFQQGAWSEKAREITLAILARQSPEGWYEEYGGADPGYQSLCTHYLAQVYRSSPDEALRTRLKESLLTSLDFLQYFVHPDGSFAGEYGSRRTEIFYPGGIALLASELPAAAAINARMRASLTSGATVTLADVDMGNLAPLLNSSILALEAGDPPKAAFLLPCEQASLSREFPQAGLYVRSSQRYYAVVGLSNGGVTKVFDRRSARIVLDDCGLLGELSNGQMISTQMSDTTTGWQVQPDELTIEGHFFEVKSSLPGPFRLALLRLMNLSLMRLPPLNELIKKLLVRLLISGRRRLALKRTRAMRFEPEGLLISDTLAADGRVPLKSLRYGGKFSAIHMASARYFTPSQLQPFDFPALDAQRLKREGQLTQTIHLDFKDA